MNVAAIPAELRQLRRWVVWRWGEVDPKTGKRKKPPYCPHDPAGTRAPRTPRRGGRSSRRSRSSTRARPTGSASRSRRPTSASTSTTSCRARPAAVIFALDSYTERSVSGRRLPRHRPGEPERARAPPGRRSVSSSATASSTSPASTSPGRRRRSRSGRPSSTRCSRSTSRRPSPAASTSRATPVDLDDQELLDRTFARPQRGAVRDLWEGDWEHRYPSQSEADLALCSHLAFWTGNDRAPDRPAVPGERALPRTSGSATTTASGRSRPRSSRRGGYRRKPSERSRGSDSR